MHGPVDMVLDHKEERCRKRLLMKETRKKKEAEQMQQVATHIEFSSGSDGESEITSCSDKRSATDYSSTKAKPAYKCCQSRISSYIRQN